jgi:hypothetical protein
MEALRISVVLGTICGNAYIQDSAWQYQPELCASGAALELGTTGKSLRMEAIKLIWRP